MNERVKALRKAKKMTQKQLGDILGIKDSAVSKIEKGENSLTEQNIRTICREFNVNVMWLRTGEGEMFIEKKPQPLDELLTELLGGETVTDEDRILVKNFLKLPDASRKVVIDFVKKCSMELSEPAKPDATGQERTVADEEKARMAAKRKAGQEEMDAAEELSPEEQEKLDSYRREMIAKRGQTERRLV